MDINTARQTLDDIERKLYAYKHAMAIISNDAETAAPAESQQGRGVALGILSGEAYKLTTSAELAAAAEYVLSHKDEADAELLRRAEIIKRDARETACIPIDEYTAFTELTNESYYVWYNAKLNNDFASYAPYLEKLVETMKRFSKYIDPEKDTYDYLLDSFEEGTSREYYDKFFDDVKAVLVPLIAKINDKKQPDSDWLQNGSYPVEGQRRLTELMFDAFCLDRNHCTCAETEHPYTNGTDSQNVRITTHYHTEDPTSSLFSVIHEGGHANYELHINPEYDYNCLGGGVSMAVHESQSRFYENYVGRSREFVEWLWPRFAEIFPEQTAGHTAEEFYRIVNAARPSLIRTEADELTYSMHIVIRYEIEKKLFAGEIAVADLPAEWNRLYKEYLGVDVPDDTRGILQDVHWSGAQFGYFPTYSLGTAYSAQILETLKKELDFKTLVAADNMHPIIDWLSERIYRFGCLNKPATYVPAITGEPFSAKYYTDYLTEKYTELYNL